MRTILISSFNPFISRNLFCGDFLTGLKSTPDAKVILIVPDYKKDFFEKNFGGGNVSIEGVLVASPSRREVLFKYLASSLVWTRTIFIHKREKLAKDGKILRFLSALFLMAIGGLRIPRMICRAVDYRLDKLEKFRMLIDKYSPSLVFATDVFNDDDVRLLHAARRAKIQTVGMIRSWDNVTTKGLFRAKPDKLVVHNEIIKKEATGYCGMGAKDVSVVGLPQFDVYFKGGHQPREEFFKKIGLDPNKKLIMFAPFGNRFWDLDWQILEILKKTGYQILARMTPQDLVDLSKFQLAPNVYIDWPGQRFHENKARDAELGQEDLQWLSDSLYYSDLVVTCGATLGMDAAVFDKPVIMIGFDGREKRLYIRSVDRFLKFNHPQIVYRTGGFKVARSEDELHKMMDEYLKNPFLDRENRQRMIKEFCIYLDGKSGERLGKFIASELAATQ